MGNSAYQVINQRVVVIGSGYAGHAAVQFCEQRFSSVIIIERREYMLHKAGSCRAAVSTSWADPVMIPDDHSYGPNTKRVTGNVKILDDKHNSIVLDDGRQIQYDYCVVASGTQNQSVCEPAISEGFSRAASKQHYENVAALIKNANTIVIAGGGKVAVELAGEIRYSYPSKELTVVGSRSELCPVKDHPSPAFSEKVKKLMESSNVHVILNDRVDFPKEQGSYIRGPVDVNLTRSRKTLRDVDLVLTCVGNKPNTEFARADLKDERGFMNVNDLLQVEGVSQGNVFAVGDCMNTDEPKEVDRNGFAHGGGHAGIVSNNIYALANGSSEGIKKYVPAPVGKYVVSFGYGKGAACGLPDFLAGLKSKSFMLSKVYRKCHAQLIGGVPAVTKEM